MILSDTDLLKRLGEGDLVVEPLDDIDQQVQPASIDLRLGTEFIEFQRTNTPCIHPTDEKEIADYTREKEIGQDDELILHPGDFILGTTKEYVEVPTDLVGTVEGRSSLGRLAIIVHATAGFCDAGYRGEITLELSNLGVAPVALTPGMRVAQLVMTELTSECSRPYGTERGSKYQGQRGPKASRLEQDNDF